LHTYLRLRGLHFNKQRGNIVEAAANGFQEWSGTIQVLITHSHTGASGEQQLDKINAALAVGCLITLFLTLFSSTAIGKGTQGLCDDKAAFGADGSIYISTVLKQLPKNTQGVYPIWTANCGSENSAACGIQAINVCTLS
jgi:hypothetical protein